MLPLQGLFRWNWHENMMDRMLAFLGWPLVAVGAMVLVVSFFTGLSHYNVVLLAGWLLVVVGAVCRVWQLKRRSRY